MSTLESGRLELSYNQHVCKVDENPNYTTILGVAMVPDRVDNQGDIASADFQTVEG